MYLTEEFHLIREVNKQFQIARLGQIGQSISNLDEFFKEICETVASVLNITHVKILQLTPDNSKLLLVAGSGWNEGLIGVATVPVDYESQAGFTLKNNRPIWVEDFSKETRFSKPTILRNHDIVSGISVTIPGYEKNFGVLGAHSQSPKSFIQDDINFLHSVGNILASGIEQYRAIAKISESEQKYKDLMEYASDPIVITDSKGYFIDVNSKVIEFTQYSKNELLQMNIADLISTEELRLNPLKFEELKNGKAIIIEREFIKKDGITVSVEINTKSFENGNIQGIIRDITRRKELEREERTR